MIIRNERRRIPGEKYLLAAGLLVLLALVVYFFVPKSSGESGPSMVECDMEKVEKLGDGRSVFMTNDVSLAHGETQSQEAARSGTHSCMVDKGHEFGFTIELKNTQPGESYEAKVWWYSPKQVGSFIVDGNWGMYGDAVETGNRDGDWLELKTNFTIPEFKTDPVIKLYAYNPTVNAAFFDDFSLIKTKEATLVEHEVAVPDSFHEINLIIGEKGMDKLERKRLGAMRKGLLVGADDDWVKAKVEEGKRQGKAKIRLKGDWTDHLRGDKWSFRIAMAPGASWNRMVTFSVQNPLTRSFMLEWVFHRWLQKEGILTPRYDFLKLKVNGKSRGIFAYEEHFDKQLPESSKRREGPIMKFIESGFWDLESAFDFGKFPDMEQRIPFYSSAEVGAFKMGRIKGDSALFRQFQIAHSLMTDYKAGKRTIWEIFDADKMARYYAIIDIARSHHGMIWHNQRLYYNPVLSRLEPIGYDGYSEGGPFVWIKRPFLGASRNFRYVSPIYKAMLFERFFLDPKFVEMYVGYLVKFSSEEYLGNLMAEMRPEIDSREKFLKQEWPEYTYNRGFLDKYAKEIRMTLYPREKTSVKAYREGKGKLGGRFRVANFHPLPLQLVGVGDGMDETIHPFKSDTMLSSYVDEFPPEMALVEATGDGKFIFFSVPGIDSTFKAEIIDYPAPGAITPEQELFSNLKLESNDMYTVNEEEATIDFNPGKFTTSKDILIPAGYSVRIPPGFDLDMVRKAKFISKSQVLAMGNVDRPIQIHSSDGTANGFTVLQVPDGFKSEFHYVVFEGMNTLNYKGWVLTGAVTMYETECVFQNCRIVNNHCEDALNIVRSVFTFSDSYIGNTFGDGFDADFCAGSVVNGTFFETGNDAMDFSGSLIHVSSVRIENCGDKGISFGEETKGTVIYADIKNSVIGIASKDVSDVEITNIELENVKQGFAVFQKKPEFGPATIKVEKHTAIEVEDLHVVQAGSKLILGERVIKGKR